MMDAHTAGVLISSGMIFGVIHVLTGKRHSHYSTGCVHGFAKLPVPDSIVMDLCVPFVSPTQAPTT